MDQTAPLNPNAPLASFARFRQSCSADFHKLRLSRTILLRIQSGAKTLQGPQGDQTHVPQGHFVYLQRGETLTIGNSVGETGVYLSQGLVIENAVIAAYLRVHPNTGNAGFRSGAMPVAFQEAFVRAAEGVSDQTLPQAVLTHRLHELLLWLSQAGAAHVVRDLRAVPDRLRDLFERRVNHAWKAPEAARALGMSEATLRRHLSREGTSFTEQLRDARVTFALMQIQTSGKSLAEIAFESGFSSQSRLSEAFKARFNLPPGKLRVPAAEMIE